MYAVLSILGTESCLWHSLKAWYSFPSKVFIHSTLQRCGYHQHHRPPCWFSCFSRGCDKIPNSSKLREEHLHLASSLRWYRPPGSSWQWSVQLGILWDFSHLCVPGNSKLRLEVGWVKKLNAHPTATHFLQQGFASKRFHSLPKQLDIKCSNPWASAEYVTFKPNSAHPSSLLFLCYEYYVLSLVE